MKKGIIGLESKRFLMLFLYGIIANVILFISSCSGDTTRIDQLFTESVTEQEIVTDVKILYSDSAQVRLAVESPKLIRQQVDKKPVEFFPEGLYVEFYHNGFQPQTWLEADKGTRFPDEKRIILEGHVRLYNKKQDKLETAELIWDEEKQEIRTEKFVRITQPEKGDTTYGFGFISDQQFNRFEIKRKFSGKIEEAMLNDLED